MTTDSPSFTALVEVLRAAGFRLVDDAEAHVALKRGMRYVQVPRDPALLAARWRSVLAAAGMEEASYRVLALDAPAVVAELPSSRKVRAASPADDDHAPE